MHEDVVEDATEAKDYDTFTVMYMPEKLIGYLMIMMAASYSLFFYFVNWYCNSFGLQLI